MTLPPSQGSASSPSNTCLRARGFLCRAAAVGFSVVSPESLDEATARLRGPVIWDAESSARLVLSSPATTTLASTPPPLVINPDRRLHYFVYPPSSEGQPSLRWNRGYPFPHAPEIIPLQFRLENEGSDRELVEKEVKVAGRRRPDLILPDPDPAPHGWHGRAVATDGEWLYLSRGDTTAGSAEYVTVYRREESGQWIVSELLGEPTDTDATGFGQALAVTGAYLAVGAPTLFDWSEEGTSRGGVFIFRRNPGSAHLTYHQLLSPPSPAARPGGFGRTLLAVEDDEGRPFLVTGGALDDQTLYLFRAGDGGSLSLAQTLSPSPGERFEGAPAGGRGVLAVGGSREIAPGAAAHGAFYFLPGTSGLWEPAGFVETGEAAPSAMAFSSGTWVAAIARDDGPRVKRFQASPSADTWTFAGELVSPEAEWNLLHTMGAPLQASGENLFVGGTRIGPSNELEPVVFHFRLEGEHWRKIQVFSTPPKAEAPPDTHLLRPIVACSRFLWMGEPTRPSGGADATGKVFGFYLEARAPLPEDPYDAFASGLAALPPETSGPAHDADGDGLSNLLEFFAGTDPLHPETSSVARLVLGTDGRPRFLFRQRLDLGGIDYQVQISSDLVEWTDVATPVFSPAWQVEGHWMREVHLDEEWSGNGPLFARLVLRQRSDLQ